jgi:transposase
MLGTTAYTANTSMKVLRTVFPNRMNSHLADITRPAHLPELVISEDFLWGYIKSQVYKTCLADTDKAKQQIRECTQRIHKELIHVTTSFSLQLQECTE